MGGCAGGVGGVVVNGWWDGGWLWGGGGGGGRVGSWGGGGWERLVRGSAIPVAGPGGLRLKVCSLGWNVVVTGGSARDLPRRPRSVAVGVAWLLSAALGSTDRGCCVLAWPGFPVVFAAVGWGVGPRRVCAVLGFAFRVGRVWAGSALSRNPVCRPIQPQLATVKLNTLHCNTHKNDAKQKKTF